MTKRKPRRNTRCLIENLESRILMAATILPVTDVRDFIFDPTRNILNIPGSGGNIYRYSLTTKTMLTPFNVLGDPDRGDITTDGQFLYLTDRSSRIIHKVNLDTGVNTNLIFNPNGGGNSSDLVIVSPTTAIFGAAGFNPCVIDLTNDAISNAPAPLSTMFSQSKLDRSADRNTILIDNNNVNGDEFSYYDVLTNTISTKRILTFGNFALRQNAVSRDGAYMIAADQSSGINQVWDRNMNPVMLTLPAGPARFSPVNDTLFILVSGTNQVRAYDTNTWVVKGSYDLESVYNYGTFNIPHVGHIAVSDDGKTLVVSTNAGINVINVDESKLANVSLTVSTPSARVNETIKLTATVSGALTGSIVFRDGNTVIATVPLVNHAASFTTLPLIDADVGTHTFTATFVEAATSVGSRSKQISFVGLPLAPSNLLAIPDRRDIIFDNARNQFLIPGDDAAIFRYSLTTGQILPAIDLQRGNLGQGDITPDGKYLLLADRTSRIIHKVDLDTGTETLLQFALPNSLQTHSNDIVVFDNSLAYLHSTGMAPAYIDIATGAITIITSGVIDGAPNNAKLFRSFDRKSILFDNSEVNGDAFNIYNKTNDTLSPTRILTFGNWALRRNAVSRNGGLASAGDISSDTNTVWDSGMNPVQLGLPGGATAFSPIADILYILDNGTQNVLAFNTNTWSNVATFPTGENYTSDGGTFLGGMSISDNGQNMAVASSKGVRIISLNTVPLPSNLNLGSTGGVPYNFTAQQFADAFTDANPGGTLQKIRFTSLPAHGALKLNGAGVSIGQQIPVAQIPNLTYTATAGFAGADNFLWSGSDQFSDAAASATLSFFVVAGSISVTYNAIDILDNDTTPTTADGTDFGTLFTNDSVEHTFTISNDSGDPLVLTGSPIVKISGGGASQFQITQPLPGIPTTFTVKFNPTAGGNASAVITIPSNDPIHPNFHFTIKGIGIAPADITGYFASTFVLPNQLTGGNPLTIPLTIANIGTGAAVGDVIITIKASPDGVWHDGDPTLVPATTKKISIPANGKTTVPFAVTVPDSSTLPLGDYTLLAKIEPQASILQIVTNNDFASQLGSLAGADAILHITPPNIDLGVSLGTHTPNFPAFLPGDKITLPLTVSNQGNLPIAASAANPIIIEVRSSTDGNFNPAGKLLFTTKLTAPLGIGGSKSFKAIFAIPAGTQPGDFFAVAKADTTGVVVDDPNAANNIVSRNLPIEWQFGNIPGRVGSLPLTAIDSDGTIIKFALSGAGSVQVVQNANDFDVTLANTTATSSLTITATKSKTPGDDGKFKLHSLIAGGALKMLNAMTANLTGNLSINSAITSITLNSVDGGGANFDIAGKLGTLTIKQNFANATLNAASIGAANITGNLTNSKILLTQPLSATAKALTSLKAAKIIGSEIRTPGNIGTITTNILDTSLIFAGVNDGETALPDSIADFINLDALLLPVIMSITIKGLPTDPTGAAFINSSVAAGKVTTVILPKRDSAIGDTDGAATPFGFASRIAGKTYAGPISAGDFISPLDAVI